MVCPQIDNDDDEFKSVSVKDVYDELRSKLSVEVGLLHGKMKSSEKEETVRRFRDGDIRILVSTTVIEVGVDIPAAANMAIENADRFGLSQLHQLRGRIGRGSMAGYCFLVSDRGSECERLEALVKTSDGFEIAEKDLALRGPGEFLGSQQHGESELAMLSLACDMETLICAKEAADSLFTCINEKTREIIDRAISKFNMQDTVQ
ncbi:MAG: hypothetical protein IJO93_01310 [Clostridia bacterium]|nr:hypothetical protein [Clostridia bacterium]